MYTIVGLGNPGDEYENTRHNIGRMAVASFAKKNDFSEWREDTKLSSLRAEGKIGKTPVTALLPNTFMNTSGKAVAPLITSKKKAETLIVVQDDLDLPLGKLKLSFNRSSGGHRGVESIIRAIKTEGFIRLRIGVSPASVSGKLKKPHGEEAVVDFILGKFKKSEEEAIKKILKTAALGLGLAVAEGRERAMGEINKS